MKDLKNVIVEKIKEVHADYVAVVAALLSAFALVLGLSLAFKVLNFITGIVELVISTK
jgi:hypothetical protein